MSVNVVVPPSSISRHPRRVPQRTKSLAQALQADAPWLGKVARVRALQVLQSRLQGRLQAGQRLLAAYARLETAQKVNAALAFHGLSPVKDVGQVHVCATPHEARRHHADHRADLVVEPEFTAQDPGVAAEL